MENAPVTLAEADVAKLLSYEALIPAMRDAFIAFSADKVQQPVRNMMTVEEGERYFGLMPAAMPGAMGAKMVSFYPSNARKGIHTHFAAIGLFDPQHGHPIAFMDGRLITEMRTAAASAAVSEVLANPESRSLALVGSGVQALAHLQALKTVFPIDDVRVWSRTDARAQAFAAAHGARAVPLKEAVEGVAQALRPLFSPGTHKRDNAGAVITEFAAFDFGDRTYRFAEAATFPVPDNELALK
ncbi:MAG: hypothetical protein MI892_13650 [Desulfobacterales bacterium]|nr:hypothetical protein [Desulfobacterales bacterium]